MLQIQWIGQLTSIMMVVAMAITIIKLAWYAPPKSKKYMYNIPLEIRQYVYGD